MQPDQAPAPGVERRSRSSLVSRDAFTTAMLNSLAEGIVACDADGSLVLFNRATREFHGLPVEPIPAAEWASHYSLLHGDGVTPMSLDEIPLIRALRGEVVEDVEMVIAPANGEPRLLLATGQQILGPDGSLQGAVVAMHDITRRQAAEERVRTQEVEARAAAAEREHVSRLRSLHGASLRLLSRDSLDALRDSLLDEALALSGAAGGRVTIAGETVEHGVDQQGEILVLPIGGHGTVTLWGAEAPDAGTDEVLRQLAAIAAGTARTLVLQDKLASARAGRMRDELIASISHDMQTPTSTLIGLANTLATSHDTLDTPTLLRVTDAMQRQGALLSDLVSQFMDYCRLEAGHALQLRTDAIDLAALVAEVAALHAHTERVQLGTIAAGAATTGDPSRLRRLGTNLVDNALTYSDGAVHIDLEIDLAAGAAVLRVRDEGPGLGDDPERLFARYERDDNFSDGTGLGLYVGRAIAEAHGGTLTGHTLPEGGALLVATLPLAVAR